MSTAILSLQSIREHNNRMKSEHTYIPNEQITESLKSQKVLMEFMEQVYELRGNVYLSGEKKGKEKTPSNMSFNQILNQYFGVDKRTFLTQLGVDVSLDSMQDIASKIVGNINLNASSFGHILGSHTKYSYESFASTQDYSNPILRFVLPELFLEAIRDTGPENNDYKQWIIGTQSVARTTGTLPKIVENDGNKPTVIGEAGNMGYGGVSIQQKSFDLKQISVGLELTDKLIINTPIDFLPLFLNEVGVKIDRAKTAEAMNVIVNGDEAGGLASIDSIGVDTVGRLKVNDISRAVTRLRRLARPATVIITNEDIGIQLTSPTEIQYVGVVPPVLNSFPDLKHYTHIPPANQVIILSKEKCLYELNYGSMTVEQDRNHAGSSTRFYVKEWTGFVNARRNAKVAIDTSVSFASNGFAPFMDVDSYIKDGFSV